METLELKAYEILKARLGEEKATTMISFVKEKSEEKIAAKKEVFLTKDDKVDLIRWMVGFWAASTAAIAALYFKMSALTVQVAVLSLKVGDLAAAVGQ